MSLNDWPAGLAGWFYEKSQAWSEGDATVRLPWCFVLDNLPRSPSSWRRPAQLLHHRPRRLLSHRVAAGRSEIGAIRG